LQEFRPNYYDLILLDIKIPILNGFELCKKIIEIDETAQIIFITALEYRKNIKDQIYPQLSNNNTIYIRKPIENQKLIK
jgi:two-component SAPR family response regulator